jgi:hypothetical protein
MLQIKRAERIREEVEMSFEEAKLSKLPAYLDDIVMLCALFLTAHSIRVQASVQSWSVCSIFKIVAQKSVVCETLSPRTAKISLTLTFQATFWMCLGCEMR